MPEVWMLKGKMVRNSAYIRPSVYSCWNAGTNDAFVTIGLGKEKFQTSVKERTEEPEWSEQCEL